MDSATFPKIADRIIKSTGNKTVFKDLQLVSCNADTRHAVIQMSDVCSMIYVKTRCSHEAIEAFDSILGTENTVSCVYDNSKIPKYHERFIV